MQISLVTMQHQQNKQAVSEHNKFFLCPRFYLFIIIIFYNDGVILTI